ncbi:LacI family DNA-binding transcriptional regulator [Pararhizobium sp.]|uniref:LacI family DNA-binding transcriptional regulator n=1 Tax=Pararhizobium sp. TaxID=1977563 RepID=UPI00271BC13F|nr:LacI family DNA-binding transcriptional regulator [Pararhizobium sp.]MDO9417804.1 LacI family DNA-binding transcriptional regulator [Pararhizobium sp.]
MTRPTMADVAKRAGVSAATVSHVLNQTRFVSPDTVAVVEEAIASIGFIPNTLARSLARSSTSSVGIVFSGIANPYFIDIITAIEEECYNIGLSVLLSDTKDDPEKELRIVRDLHQRRVDGIILAPAPDPSMRTLKYLKLNSICTVLVDRIMGQDFDEVGVENHLALHLLVDHLVEHGYRHIGMVPGHEGYSTTLERRSAFTARMAHHELSESAVVSASCSTSLAAETAAIAMLQSANRPRAIIAGNNLSTIGCMRAIRRLGLRVPEDVALVGVDDFEWADSFEPRLTLVAQPCTHIGQRAAAMMAARIKNAAGRPTTVRLKPSLIIRNSCGC